MGDFTWSRLITEGYPRKTGAFNITSDGFIEKRGLFLLMTHHGLNENLISNCNSCHFFGLNIIRIGI